MHVVPYTLFAASRTRYSRLSFLVQQHRYPMRDARRTLRERDGEKERNEKNVQTGRKISKPGNLRYQTRIPRETFNPVSVLSRKILCTSLSCRHAEDLSIRKRGSEIRLIHLPNVLELIRIKKTLALRRGNVAPR